MLINVLFLSIMHAHEGLNRLDNALGIPDQVAIGVCGGRPVASRSRRRARCRISRCADSWRQDRVRLPGTGETGVDFTLVSAFVLDNPPCHDLAGLADQRDSFRETGVVQRIGNFS